MTETLQQARTSILSFFGTHFQALQFTCTDSAVLATGMAIIFTCAGFGMAVVTSPVGSP